jgi:type III secretion protein J
LGYGADSDQRQIGVIAVQPSGLHALHPIRAVCIFLPTYGFCVGYAGAVAGQGVMFTSRWGLQPTGSIMARTKSATRRLIGPVILCFALALMGCKEVLYSTLTENEANEMVAILDASGIVAKRESDKDGNYALKVDGEMVADAVTILRSAGYPRQRFKSLGDVFANEGLVGTPFEERARFMFALNEELSRTISEIAGIRLARVQVMIPAPDKYATVVPTATASVALLFEPGYDLSPLVPNIKSLVAHSVPDLDYDDVSVAMFPVDVMTLTTDPAVTEPAAEVTAMSVLPAVLSDPLAVLVGALVLMAAFCAWIVLRGRSGSSA